MIVDLEALPLPDGGDHVRLEAEVQLDHAVALRACQVVVVPVAFAQAEGMRAIGELDSVQHLHPHEFVDGAVDSGASDPWIGAAQLLEQLIRGKRGAGMSEANQVLCYGPAWLGPPFAELLESRVDPFLDVPLLNVH